MSPASIGDAFRRLPGGGSVLRARRRAVGATRRRLRPPRPPYGPPERVRALEETPPPGTFLTGNGIAARCRHVLNFDVLRVNEDVQNDWWFCKADYLEYFFARCAPRTPFVLFSHNSDRTIGRSFRRELRRPSLVAWFAQNATLDHPKLRALPIGIANPFWPHGDQGLLEQVRAESTPKRALFDVSFALATNPRQRRYCLEQTGLELAPRVPYHDYLRRLASAYFCISPEGHGVDCVRTWEALALGTVPVVTRSLLTDQHPDLPLIVLDDWSDFRSLELTRELYERTWDGWTSDEIRLERYLERVERTIGGLRG